MLTHASAYSEGESLMPWIIWLAIGWLGACVCLAIGITRWFRYVRDQKNRLR
jgi:hypothetical protein